MFLLKTKQRRQTDGEALVQCSLDGFGVLSLNLAENEKKLAETGLHGLQLLECMDVHCIHDDVHCIVQHVRRVRESVLCFSQFSPFC